MLNITEQVNMTVTTRKAGALLRTATANLKGYHHV